MVFRRLPGVYADQLPLSPVDYAIGRFGAKLQLFILQVNMLFGNFLGFLTSLRIIAPNPLPEAVNLHQKIIHSTPTPSSRELLTRIINPLSLSQ